MNTAPHPAVPHPTNPVPHTTASPLPPRGDAADLRCITGGFGVSVDAPPPGGVDASWLATLLAEHLVVVIRNAGLDPAAQVRLARQLGEPTPAHPVVPGTADHPEILELDAATGGRNACWHTDVTFVAEPPSVSLLVADEVPSHGGDTLWADLRGAYATLSAPLRTALDGLEAVHRVTPLAYWGEPVDASLDPDVAASLHAQATQLPSVIHPVVRVHPVTGERALFVNPGFTSHVVGLSHHESDSLLNLVYTHATQPAHTLRHRWSPGDLVVWDNRATMHYATDDLGAASRRVRRVTLRGERPRGPAGQASRVVDDPLVAVR